jgi:hypothetical protein
MLSTIHQDIAKEDNQINERAKGCARLGALTQQIRVALRVPSCEPYK